MMPIRCPSIGIFYIVLVNFLITANLDEGLRIFCNLSSFIFFYASKLSQIPVRLESAKTKLCTFYLFFSWSQRIVKKNRITKETGKPNAKKKIK